MPKKLSHHCAVRVENYIYVHGGFEYPKTANLDTYVLNIQTRKWTVVPSKPDCGTPPDGHKTACAIWNNENLVVPTFDVNTTKTCTAILNIKTQIWSKLKEDKRHLIVGGTMGT